MVVASDQSALDAADSLAESLAMVVASDLSAQDAADTWSSNHLLACIAAATPKGIRPNPFSTRVSPL